MKRFIFVVVAAALPLLLSATADSVLAQSAVGLRLFETRCARCHQNAQDKSAPDASVLRRSSRPRLRPRETRAAAGVVRATVLIGPA